MMQLVSRCSPQSLFRGVGRRFVTTKAAFDGAATYKPVSSKRKMVIGLLGGVGFGGMALVYALERSVNTIDLELHPQRMPWFHNKAWHGYDIRSVRRGWQVFKQVCSACHGIKYYKYRQFLGKVMTEDEAKAEAAEHTFDDIDMEGRPKTRPGDVNDTVPEPYPNKKAAAAANNGKAPPDLTLIVPGRHGNEDYIFAFLNGYMDPPAGVEVDEGLAYNAYFLGGVVAMPPQLFDEGIEFEDGTPATVSQQAKDVVTFLCFLANPSIDERKKLALHMIFIGGPISFFLLYMKRHVWTFYKHYKHLWRTVKGREPPQFRDKLKP